jgi:hypothetical protein
MTKINNENIHPFDIRRDMDAMHYLYRLVGVI